jgi:hypothetical protein
VLLLSPESDAFFFFKLSSNQQTILGNIRATQQGTRPQQIPFYEVQPGNKISKLKTPLH